MQYYFGKQITINLNCVTVSKATPGPNIMKLLMSVYKGS